MKIESLHIEGFGHFADQSFGPFLQPVTVVLGHNEAGKSTLLAFIRTILFGFRAQKRGDFYPALKGGRHGGRVTLIGDDGLSYTVERIEDARAASLKITSSAGLQTTDDGLLRPLLGNSSRQVFEAVFALGLLDLQNLKRLNDSDASAQIYAAGMGAANLPKAIKSIEDARGQLFLPGRNAKNPEAAPLLARLREIEDDLQGARGDAALYASLTRRHAELEDEIQQATARLAADSRSLGEVSRLQQAWDDWVTLGDAEARLRDLPDQPGFPEDGVSRLDRAEDALREAVQASREAAKQCELTDQRANAPIPGETLLNHRERIDELRRQRGAFDASVADLPKRRTELDAQERDLLRALADLGPDWTEARAISFDTSIPLRDSIEQWRQRLESVDITAREAARVRERAEQSSRDAADEEERLRLALEATPRPSPDAQAYEGARAALSLSRVRLVEYQRAVDRRANAEASANQAVPVTVAPSPAPQSAVPAIVLAAAGLVAAVGGVVLGGNALMLGAVLGLALFGAGVAMFFISRRAPQSATAAAPTTVGGAYLDSLHAQEQAALAALQSAAQPIVLDIPTVADLENVALSLDRTEREGRELAAAQKQWQEARDEHQRLASRFDAAVLALEEAAQHLAAAGSAWKEWLAERGLSPTLLPATVVALFARLETVDARIEAATALRHRVNAIEDDVEAYRALVRPLATEHGIAGELSESAAVAAAADRLDRDFESVAKDETRREEARKALEEERRRLADLESRESAARTTLEGLLAAGKASDAEQFRRNARSHDDRLRALKEMTEAETRLRRLSGPGEQYAAFRVALANTNVAALDQEHERLSLERTEEEDRRGTLQTERGSITADIERLVSDEHASELRAERAVLVEQLRGTARRWAILTVARTLLGKAQRKYEEEHQPDVLRNAQEFFATVTGGRYVRLISPLGSELITTVASDGSSKTTGQLSRGTEDQLYLALRFGLIREFGARSAYLPVIVDDILVNFDPERAQRAAAAFTELAQTNQVLVFTCHPSTADLFRNASTAVQVIDLPEATNHLSGSLARN